MLTKRQVLEKLEQKILTEEDLVEVGKYAYFLYEQRIENADEIFYKNLLDVATMEYGLEYFLSLDQLDKILDNLYDDLYRFDKDRVYTMLRFCRELKNKLRNKISKEDIGCWACCVPHRFDIKDQHSYNLLDLLARMEIGIEPQLSYEELNHLVDQLITDEVKKLQ